MKQAKRTLTHFLILSIAFMFNSHSLLSMEEEEAKPAATATVASSSSSSSSSSILWAVSTCKGKKPTMEDTYTAIPEFNGDGSAFFAVYDGHRGHQASHYAAAHLHTFFSDRLQEEKTIPASLHAAFEQTNTQIPSDAEGTTATVAFISRNRFLHTAYVGDSRLIVVRDGKVIYKTEDHQPSNEKERARIEAMGGKIYTFGTPVPRIGGLMVSRSLGDKTIKTSNAGGVKEGVISSTPQIMCFEFEDPDIGVIASDGLWEVATSPEVASLLNNLLKRKAIISSEAETEDNGNDENLRQIARQLCAYAYAEKRSSDNIAVLLFRRAHEAPEEKEPGLKERLASKFRKQK